MKRFQHYILKLSVLLVLIMVFSSAAAAAGKTVVVLPDTGGPLRDIYAAIIEGIKLESQAAVESLFITEDSEPAAVIKQLQNRRATGVITLGTQGQGLAEDLAEHFPTVAGALVAKPENLSGVSLIADPEALFAHLTRLVPQSRRVFVVYSEAENGWLISAARKAAAKYGLELLAHPAKSLRGALREYRKLLIQLAGREDAVWLPIDRNTVDDSVILPLLLKQAWSRNFVLFSSKPSHVKKGALFTFYPDNLGLGRQLVNLLGRQQSGVIDAEFLKSVLVAVNLRTATHLGVSFDAEQKRNIFLLYPPK